MIWYLVKRLHQRRFVFFQSTCRLFHVVFFQLETCKLALSDWQLFCKALSLRLNLLQLVGQVLIHFLTLDNHLCIGTSRLSFYESSSDYNVCTSVTEISHAIQLLWVDSIAYLTIVLSCEEDRPRPLHYHEHPSSDITLQPRPLLDREHTSTETSPRPRHLRTKIIRKRITCHDSQSKCLTVNS